MPGLDRWENLLVEDPRKGLSDQLRVIIKGGGFSGQSLLLTGWV
jgi:hypothetical protein